MVDDRMMNEDLDRNLGGTGSEHDKYGKKTPERNPKDDRSTGQRGGQSNEPHRGGKGFDKGGSQGKPGESQSGQNR